MHLSVQDTYFDAIFVKRFSIAFVSNVLHYFRKIFCFFLLVNFVYVYKLYLLDFNRAELRKRLYNVPPDFVHFTAVFFQLPSFVFFSYSQM